MENRLKPETAAVISKLKDANIRTIMCTGDNILTALSVARDCKIIDVNESVVIVEAKSGEEPTFKHAEDVFYLSLTEWSVSTYFCVFLETAQDFSLCYWWSILRSGPKRKLWFVEKSSFELM